MDVGVHNNVALDFTKLASAEGRLLAKLAGDKCMKCVAARIEAIKHKAALTQAEPQAKIDAMTAAIEAVLAKPVAQ